ncbi:MAG: amidohydrolase family protein [SAR202 cluster bacterium]|nr:amidohydrolase family protein [SAR202 cluster bacterium]
MTTQQADYLIANGLVVSGTCVAKQDVLVKGEAIARVGADVPKGAAKKVIDASGKYVLPGVIDAHNHPDNSDKMDTFSVSAAYGGITTIIPFIRSGRHQGASGTIVDAVKRFIEEGQRTSVLDFGGHASLVGGDDVERDVPALIRMGVLSFKMYMTYPRRGIMIPDDRMVLAIALASREGGLAMVHAENGYVIDYLEERFISEGKVSAEYYAPSRPRILEAEAVMRAATYASTTDCPMYVVHLSARESMDIVANWKDQGLRLYGETCPQYLALTDEAMRRDGALAKIAPPLREPEDNEAMWEGLATGLIDTVGSDFCGFTKAQKRSGGRTPTPEPRNPGIRVQGSESGPQNIFEAAFGGNSAEQMLPVVYHGGVNQGRITLPRLVQVMCENPAKIFGLYPQKGTLQPGADADIVVFDPSVKHTLGAAAQHCKADFTGFEGMEVLGNAVFTMQRGEVVIEGGELRRKPGKAKYLAGDPGLAAYAPKGHAVG